MPEKRHYQNDNSQISREGNRMKTVWMWEKKESGFVNAGFWSGGRGITHLCLKNTKTIGNNNKWSVFTKRIKEVVGRWREGWARMTNPHLVSTWSIQEPRMVTSPSNWPSLAHYRIKGEICNLLKKNNGIGHCVVHGATNHLVECNTSKTTDEWLGAEQGKTDTDRRVVTLRCQI